MGSQSEILCQWLTFWKDASRLLELYSWLPRKPVGMSRRVGKKWEAKIARRLFEQLRLEPVRGWVWSLQEGMRIRFQGWSRTLGKPLVWTTWGKGRPRSWDGQDRRGTFGGVRWYQILLKRLVHIRECSWRLQEKPIYKEWEAGMESQ